LRAAAIADNRKRNHRMKRVQPTGGTGQPPSTVDVALVALRPAWLSWCVAALAAALLASLTAPLLISPPSQTAHPMLMQFLEWTHRIVALFLGVLLLVWIVNVHTARRRARTRARLWEQSIESMNVGVALWDASDRLIGCNAAYRALYSEIAADLVPGRSYRELMTTYYAVAPPEVVDGRALPEFIAKGEQRRRSGSELSEVVRHHRGRWLLMTDCRTASGGIISFRNDITEQKVIEHELTKRRKLIDDLAELTYDWFWRQDADGRFVEFSAAMERHVRAAPDQLLGRRREDMPGFEADPNQYAEYRARVAQRQPFPWFTYRARRGDGSPMWVAVAGKPIFDEKGEFQGYYGAGRDVTEREDMLTALRRSEERFRALTMLATEWYWETDTDLRVTSVRGEPASQERFAAWTLNRRFWEFEQIDPTFAVDWSALRERVARRESFRGFKLKLRNRDDVAYCELAGQPVFDRGEFLGYRGLAWDVTERESLIARISDSEARFRALTELSSDWYWEMDETLRFTLVRQGARGSFGLNEDEVTGRHPWELPGELIQPSSWDEHRTTLLGHRSFRDVMFRRWMPDGSLVYHLTSGDPVIDADGKFRGYRGIGKNISEQIRSQERIERLATVDALTQLANRQTFDERAGRLLASSYAEGKRCALLFIDLDNFRLLNNGYGHRVGDEMLAIVASRMRDVVGEPHLIGRRGGDELVVLLVDLHRPDAAVEVARKLIDAICEPARVLGMEIAVTASVGISFFPQDGIDLDSLLNAADAAMYQAKDSGRRTYAFYTQTVARRVDLRLRLEQRLRKAVESRDFKLFFQPLVSLADGKMIGAEALIRWRDAELGDISPAEFIPIAEESGLIVGLGDWVLREACRSRQEWRHLQLDIPPVAINMSGVQLRQLGCVEGLLDVLNAYEVAPSEIEVEVTETGLLDTSAVSRENLVRMRNAGVRLALDDFGVGFSSLAHLRDLPIHRLKIDRSFTVECMRDARTLTIVKAVIEMARSLGISVTAEGIETQAQQTWMQHLGCDAAQGYLFARPMPGDDFIKLFIDRRGTGRERSLMH
jgi:diguanylate cyclase (GGDEF)-like protein/PAS domain S-box-containing protein